MAEAAGGETILVLAPTGRDAEAAAALLDRDGMVARVCASLEELCDRLDDATGAVMVAEEALAQADLRRLAAVLERQPPWSDLPFVVLTRAALDARRAALMPRLADALGNVMLLERPLNAPTLVSALRTALRARRRQHQVRDHLREREQAAEHLQLLMNELNHRVKNTLATVQSIAAQTLRGAATDSAHDVFEARLMSLSRAHDLLTEDNWQGASLRELVAQALAPYAAEGGRYILDCPDVRLRPKSALAFSMAFHELATNAAKYGALSCPAGQVRVTWDTQASPEGHRLRLRWTESGGPPVEAPRRKGFGSRLIERGLAHELHGEARLSYDPGGVVCIIDVPLAAAGGGDFL